MPTIECDASVFAGGQAKESGREESDSCFSS